MAITLGLLPQWAREDTRYGYSAIDTNQNLYFGPITQNGPQFTSQASGGWATATMTFFDPNRSYLNSQVLASGATASFNLLMLSYDDITYWVPSQVPTKCPAFLAMVATQAGWTVT